MDALRGVIGFVAVNEIKRYGPFQTIFAGEWVASDDPGQLLVRQHEGWYRCDRSTPLQSICQGWAVDRATDLRNGPLNGDAVSTPLLTKLLVLASPSRHLD